MTDTSPELVEEVTERDELLAQLEAERQRQISERMLVREYVERMFAHNDGYIARAASPCTDGVNSWLIRNNIPGMRCSLHHHSRLIQGTPEQIQVARRIAESQFPGLRPDMLSSLTEQQLRAQLAAAVRQGTDWRNQFIINLRSANDQWTNIPDSLVVELINRLLHADADAEAQPQAAPFPVPEAAAPPAPPQPQPVMVDMMVALSIRLSAELAGMRDADLQVAIGNRIRQALRDGVSRTHGAAVEDDILSSIRIVRR